MVLAWLIPNHYPPWTSFYNEICMALALGFFTAGLLRRREPLSMPAVAWCVVAVATIPSIQWFLGLLKFSGDAWVSSLYLLGFALAISAGYAWARLDSKRLSTGLAAATLAAGVGSSVLALLQAFQIDALGMWMQDAVSGMRPHANLGQPNNLATLLGLAVLSLWLLIEQGRLGRIPGICLLLPLLAGMALTQSRTALLFGPLIFLGLLFFAKARHLPLAVSSLSVATATAFHWLLAWTWPRVQEALLLSAGPGFAERGVGSARFQLWSMLIDSASSRPWSGYGWLQIGAAELAVADRYPPVNELWLHGHNMFLEFVVWCGYPLGLSLVGLTVGWLVLRALTVVSIEAAIAWMVIALLGLHAILELPHHYAYFLLPAGIWIGLIEHSANARRYLSPRWGTALAAVALTMCVALARDYAAVEEDFRLVRFELLGIGSLRASEPAPQAPFLSSLTAYLAFSRTPPVSGMTAKQLQGMSDVVDRYPYAPAMSRLAVALALNDRLSEATRMFVRIRHIHGAATFGKLRSELNARAASERGLQPLSESLRHVSDE